MRLKNILNESAYSDPYEIVELLYSKSLPFIMYLIRNISPINLGTPMLLSGRHDDSPIIFKDIRTDRYPKDTPVQVHNAIDDMFHRIFGIRSRSGSIFLTGKYSTAGGYGSKVYSVFPTGTSYDIIWSPTISDLWTDKIEDTEFMNLGSDVGEVMSYIEDSDFIGDFDEEVNDELYREFEIDNNIKDFESEDDYNAARYDYIDDNSENRKNEKLKLKAEEMIEHIDNDFYHMIKYNYKKGDIKGAIHSNNEVMLSGTSYIAVRIDYLPYVLRYIEINGSKKPTPELFVHAIKDMDFSKFYYHDKVGYAKNNMRRMSKKILDLINIDDLKKPE
jgi:hypothetical protein